MTIMRPRRPIGPVLLIVRSGLLLAARGASASPACPVRHLYVDEVPELPLREPVIAYFDASTPKASERGWSRKALLRDYGKLTCPVVSRHVWDLYESHPRCDKFIKQMPALGGPAPVAPPPLSVSFRSPKGGEAAELQVRGDVEMPSWARAVLGEKLGSKFSLSLGANGSGIRFHSSHTRTVVGVLSGRKRWVLTPPESFERLHKDGSDLYARSGAGVALPGKAWDARLRKRLVKEIPGAVDCLQEAGTVLALPDYWGHATINEGDCVAVGVQVTDQESPAWSAKGPLDEAKREAVLKAVEGGVQGESQRKELLALARRTLKANPLQALRELGRAQQLWQLLSADAFAAMEMSDAVEFTVKWVNDSVREARVSPEHGISVVATAFPFGLGLAKEGRIRSAARVAFHTGLSFWALPFDEPGRRARAGAAAVLAAMAADLGDVGNTSSFLSLHWAHSAGKGDHVAVRSDPGAVGDGQPLAPAWRRCVVARASAEALEVRCLVPAEGPGEALAAASCGLAEEPQAPVVRAVGNLSLGQKVTVESLQGGGAWLSAPVRGWASLRDDFGQVVLAARPTRSQPTERVPRDSGRLGWRVGARAGGSTAFQLAAQLSPALALLAAEDQTDPTAATVAVGAGESVARLGEEEL